LKKSAKEKNDELLELLKLSDAVDEKNFSEKNNIFERKKHLDTIIAEKKATLKLFVIEVKSAGV